MSIPISDALKWLLVIIKLANRVEGSTRLQKLAFLAHQDIKELSQFHFYADWKPSKFGPMSEDLAKDVDNNIDKLIGKWPIPNEAGYKVDNFGLINEGDSIAQEMMRAYPKIKEKIEPLVRRYSRLPLMSLLHDVYYQYPQYAVVSGIKSEVAGKTGTFDTPLSPEYDESSD